MQSTITKLALVLLIVGPAAALNSQKPKGKHRCGDGSCGGPPKWITDKGYDKGGSPANGYDSAPAVNSGGGGGGGNLWPGSWFGSQNGNQQGGQQTSTDQQQGGGGGGYFPSFKNPFGDSPFGSASFGGSQTGNQQDGSKQNQKQGSQQVSEKAKEKQKEGGWEQIKAASGFGTPDIFTPQIPQFTNPFAGRRDPEGVSGAISSTQGSQQKSQGGSQQGSNQASQQGSQQAASPAFNPFSPASFGWGGPPPPSQQAAPEPWKPVDLPQAPVYDPNSIKKEDTADDSTDSGFTPDAVAGGGVAFPTIPPGYWAGNNIATGVAAAKAGKIISDTIGEGTGFNQPLPTTNTGVRAPNAGDGWDPVETAKWAAAKNGFNNPVNWIGADQAVTQAVNSAYGAAGISPAARARYSPFTDAVQRTKQAVENGVLAAR